MFEDAKLLNDPSLLCTFAPPPIPCSCWLVRPPAGRPSLLLSRLKKPLWILLLKDPPARLGGPYSPRCMLCPARPPPDTDERMGLPLTLPPAPRASGGASRRTRLLTAKPKPLVLPLLSIGRLPALYSRKWLPNTSSIMCSLASMPQSITTSSLLRAMPSGCLRHTTTTPTPWEAHTTAAQQHWRVRRVRLELVCHQAAGTVSLVCKHMPIKLQLQQIGHTHSAGYMHSMVSDQVHCCLVQPGATHPAHMPASLLHYPQCNTAQHHSLQRLLAPQLEHQL